jgi:methylated-DNA-protein-cysteine methyltransferase-like protein
MPEKSSGGHMQDQQPSPAATTNFYQQVYALVRQVPAGKVVTYGQVAALLGSPRAARAVGYALRFLPAGSDVPWHRVINYQGGISPRYPAESPIIQRVLLEAEGVCFDAQERVTLAHYRWQPHVQVAKNHRRRTKCLPQSAIINPLYDKP